MVVPLNHLPGVWSLINHNNLFLNSLLFWGKRLYHPNEQSPEPKLIFVFFPECPGYRGNGGFTSVDCGNGLCVTYTTAGTGKEKEPSVPIIVLAPGLSPVCHLKQVAAPGRQVAGAVLAHLGDHLLGQVSAVEG